VNIQELYNYSEQTQYSIIIPLYLPQRKSCGSKLGESLSPMRQHDRELNKYQRMRCSNPDGLLRSLFAVTERTRLHNYKWSNASVLRSIIPCTQGVGTYVIRSKDTYILRIIPKGVSEASKIFIQGVHNIPKLFSNELYLQT
jgi:hypothetical protein